MLQPVNGRRLMKIAANRRTPLHVAPVFANGGQFQQALRHDLGSRVGFATHRENKRTFSHPTARVRVSSVRRIVRACYTRFDHVAPLEERGRRSSSTRRAVFQCVDQLNLK
jgi:hypothetical protein